MPTPPYTDPHIAPDLTLDEQTAQGPFCRVIIHNDNVTPMDFVIQILVSIFRLDSPHAMQVMFTAHYQDHAYVQSLPKPEALRRIGTAHISARLHHYPLLFTLEAE
jgi:ATP-dependent Clp protease adaptor protein ClpS